MVNRYYIWTVAGTRLRRKPRRVQHQRRGKSVYIWQSYYQTLNSLLTQYNWQVVSLLYVTAWWHMLHQLNSTKIKKHIWCKTPSTIQSTSSVPPTAQCQEQEVKWQSQQVTSQSTYCVLYFLLCYNIITQYNWQVVSLLYVMAQWDMLQLN